MLTGKVSRRPSDLPIKIDMAARILGALGQSGALSNLSTLAEAAENGVLPMTDELGEELRVSCALIIAMRNDLITAHHLMKDENEHIDVYEIEASSQIA